jgi:hypothetical protein
MWRVTFGKKRGMLSTNPNTRDRSEDEELTAEELQAMDIDHGEGERIYGIGFLQAQGENRRLIKGASELGCCVLRGVKRAQNGSQISPFICSNSTHPFLRLLRKTKKEK